MPHRRTSLLSILLCATLALARTSGAAEALGPGAGPTPVHVYGIEVERGAEADRLLVFAEHPVAAHLSEPDPSRVRLVLPGAVLDPSAPREVAGPRAGSVASVSVSELSPPDAPGVQITIRRAPGAPPQLSRRGSMLAVDFPRAGGAAAARIRLQYQGQDIADVVRALSQETGRSFLFDDQLRGSITISVAEPVSEPEALAILEAALLLKGFVSVPTPGGARKILRLADLPASAPWIPESVLSGRESAVTTRVPVESVDVDVLAAALDPLLGQAGLVLPYRPTHSLILASTERNLHRALQVVRALDRSGAQEILVRKLHHRPVGEAAALLREIFDSPAALGVPVEVWSDERTQALIVRSSPERLDEVRNLIDRIDVPEEGHGRIRVIPVLYADAERLAQTLQSLASGAPAPSATGTPGFAAAAARAAPLTERAFRVAVHPATRALVVSADSETHALLLDLIRTLDQPPPQIHVEATVLEFTTTGALALGFDAFVPVTDPKEPSDLIAVIASNPSGNLATTPSLGQTAAAAASFTRTPLTFPIIGPDGDPVDVVVPRDSYVLTADESEVRTHVLVRSHILALPGEEHEIFAGNNIPIPVSARQGSAVATSSLSVNQSVERQDVGVRLNVQPFAWQGNQVRLELRLDESRVAPSVAGPVEEVGVTLERRRLEAVVYLRQGEFAVVGSLTRPRFETLRSGTPFLSDIPILGWFFRADRERMVRDQLVIAVRAWVQRTAEEDQAQSIRRRLAFERSLARIEELVESGAAPYAVLASTAPSFPEAEAVARVLTPPPESSVQIVEWRSPAGRPRFDVYLTRFARLAQAARTALRLSDEGWAAEVVALPPGRGTEHPGSQPAAPAP